MADYTKVLNVADNDIAKANNVETDNFVKINGVGRSDGPPEETALWVAVGLNGRVSYSSDATSWTDYIVPASTANDYYDISYGKNPSGGDRWYVVRYTAPANVTPSEIMYSDDPTGGESSWTYVNITGDHRSKAIEYGANGTIILGNKTTSVARSTDGGATWVEHSVPGGTSMATCLATDGEGFWCMGTTSDGIYKSWDDGITWKKSRGRPDDINGLEYANDTWVATYQVNDIYYAASGSLSHDATNDNSSWNGNAVHFSVQPDSLCHHAGDTWFASGAGKDVWKSTTNANGWTQVSDIVTSDGATDIAYSLASDGSTLIAVTKAGNISKSTDLGDTWTEVHNPAVNRSLYSVEYSRVKPTE